MTARQASLQPTMTRSGSRSRCAFGEALSNASISSAVLVLRNRVRRLVFRCPPVAREWPIAGSWAGLKHDNHADTEPQGRGGSARWRQRRLVEPVGVAGLHRQYVLHGAERLEVRFRDPAEFEAVEAVQGPLDH